MTNAQHQTRRAAHKKSKLKRMSVKDGILIYLPVLIYVLLCLIPFIALLCLIFPLVLTPFDAADVPVLRALLYPWLLLPVGSFFSGLSLGKRQGFCPLYPVACVLGILVFIPLARLFSNMYDWPLVTIALVCSLAGNLAGSALRRVRKGGAGA